MFGSFQLEDLCVFCKTFLNTLFFDDTLNPLNFFLFFFLFFTFKLLLPNSSGLAWKIPWMEEPGRPQSMGSLRVGQDSATSLSLFLSWIGEGSGTPLQCSCLENPRDGGPGGLPSVGSHRGGHG